MDEDLGIDEKIKKLLDKKRQQLKALEKEKGQLPESGAFSVGMLGDLIPVLKKQVERLEMLSKLSSIEALQRILEGNF